MDRSILAPADLVRDSVEMNAPLTTERGVALDADVEPDLPSVKADGARVRQVLSNLIANALEFTPEKGRITIAARKHGEAGVRFSVRDTGPGFDPEEVAHVFDRFWQGERSGRRCRTGARHQQGHRRSARWPDLDRR